MNHFTIFVVFLDFTLVSCSWDSSNLKQSCMLFLTMREYFCKHFLELLLFYFMKHCGDLDSSMAKAKKTHYVSNNVFLIQIFGKSQCIPIFYIFPVKEFLLVNMHLLLIINKCTMSYISYHSFSYLFLSFIHRSSGTFPMHNNL